MIHTDLEGLFHLAVTGKQHFQAFVDEAICYKRIQGLKTRDAAADTAANDTDEMAWGGVAIKCISGNGAGELGRSVKCQLMLADRGIR